MTNGWNPITEGGAYASRLPLGWEYPEPNEALSRLAELHRELPSGHRLHGVRVETFAQRVGDDDTLFRHVDQADLYTVVHLTWLGREEIDVRHPMIDFEGTLTEFFAREERIIAGSAPG